MRALVAFLVAVLISGCSPSRTGSTGGDASPTEGAVTGELTVFAAASLNSTFTDLGGMFENEHPGTKVRFSFAGSSDLVTQLTQGAPADVFAAADTRNMSQAAEAGLLSGKPTDFAGNTLTIVTPPGNPRGIATFADLALPGVQVVVCAPQVPCGAATEKVEKTAGITLTPVSEESSVTDVLGKITSGQADVGLVYVTDAAGAGNTVTAVPFPESGGVVNTYPIAVLQDAANPAAAQAFVDLVTGPQGQQVLAAAGFATP